MYVFFNSCANRESNPGLLLGRQRCYHYTIGAKIEVPGGISPPGGAHRAQRGDARYRRLVTVTLVHTGLEPVTLALLAPRSNQLS